MELVHVETPAVLYLYLQKIETPHGESACVGWELQEDKGKNL